MNLMLEIAVECTNSTETVGRMNISEML